MTMNAQQQRAIFELHNTWVQSEVADHAWPTPPDAPLDYNQHAVDMGAEGAAMDRFHDRAREILGLPRARSLRP
jgi:hypothetical protein